MAGVLSSDTSGVARLLSALACAAVLAIATQSQPPPPRGRQEQRPPQQQPGDEQHQAGRSAAPPPSSALAPEQTPSQDQNERRGQPQPDRWSLVLTGLLVLVTAGLVKVGLLQRETLEATNNLSIAVQRAYVSITQEPEAFRPEDWTSSLVEWKFAFKVTNEGNTPATILGVGIEPLVARELPQQPPYATDQEPFEALIMPRDHIDTNRTIPLTSQFASIRKGEQKLWLIGYVDYRDVFGYLYRGGYARRWEPNKRGTLVFETTPGYNYDRQTGRDQQTRDRHRWWPWS